MIFEVVEGEGLDEMRRAETISLIFVLLLVAILVGVVYYQQAIQASQKVPPGEISFSQFTVVGLDSVNASGSTFVVQFRITDLTPLGGMLVNASYDLYGDGSYVGRGTIVEPVKIPARNSVVTKTSLLLPLGGGSHAMWSYIIDNGQVTWEVRGNATLIEPIIGILNLKFDCRTVNRGSISCGSLTL